jgi:hypothetical protein
VAAQWRASNAEVKKRKRADDQQNTEPADQNGDQTFQHASWENGDDLTVSFTKN